MFSLTIRKVVVRERERERGNRKGNGRVRGREESGSCKRLHVYDVKDESSVSNYISLCVYLPFLWPPKYPWHVLQLNFAFCLLWEDKHSVWDTKIMLRDTSRIRIDNEIMNVNTWNYIQIKLGCSSSSFFYYFCITFTRVKIYV